MAQMKPIYTTLSRSVRETRLLLILPDSSPSSLKCELSVHRLGHTEAVTYTALSYVWGEPDPSEQCTIVLNDINFPATPNLLQALHSFRKLGHDGYLWADAVRIHQSDLEEKMDQVSKMDIIYARATTTIVWLGPTEDDSDAGMDLVANLQEGGLAVPGFHVELRRGLLAVTKLMQRPWWTRTWILQEAFLSRNLVARCGLRDVPFTRFVFLKKQTNEAYWTKQGKWRDITIFERIPFSSCLSNWDITKAGLSSSGRSYQLDATEKRDKVFALLGLVPDEDRAAIRPDYTRSMRDILIDVTLQSIRREGLMFLNLVEPEDMKPCDLNFPSWVPYRGILGEQRIQNLVSYKPQFGANLAGDQRTWAKLFKESRINASNPTSVLLSEDRKHAGMFLDGIEVDEVTFADPMPHVREYRGLDDLVAAKIKAERVRVTIDTIKAWELQAHKCRPSPPVGATSRSGAVKKPSGGLWPATAPPLEFDRFRQIAAID